MEPDKGVILALLRREIISSSELKVKLPDLERTALLSAFQDSGDPLFLVSYLRKTYTKIIFFFVAITILW